MASKGLVEQIAEQFEKPGVEEIAKCLRDSQDKAVISCLIKHNCQRWEDLQYYLAQETKDPEVRAHILGAESAEEYRKLVEETNEMIKRVYE